jgi:hypothetical protein
MQCGPKESEYDRKDRPGYEQRNPLYFKMEEGRRFGRRLIHS